MSLKMKRGKKVAVIIAVILIPLVYSYFYLDAFWDPYSKLQDLPVAVVNEDTGAEINGTVRNVGNEITDKLKTDRNLKWVVTNLQDARDGLENRRYYAEVVIPKDFSSSLSTANSKNKTQGVIFYQPNEKRNFLAGQVLNRVMLEMKDNISQDVTKEIVSNMVVEVRKMPADLKDVEEGFGKLTDGAKTLQDGIGELKGGQKTFNDGFSSLNNGIADANQGIKTLGEGSKGIAGGLQEFNRKLSAGSQQILPLVQGSDQFTAGIENLNQGIKQFSSGMDTLKAGSVQLSKGTMEYMANMRKFDEGLGLFLDASGKAVQANKSAADSLAAYIQGHPEAMNDPNIQNMIAIYQQSGSNLEILQNTSGQLKASSSALLQGALQLEEGSKNVTGGADLLGQNAQKLAQGSEQLVQSFSQIHRGIQDVSDNMATAAKNAGLLASGADELGKGVSTLQRGMGRLAQGSSELYDSTGKLTEGQQKLYDGAGDMKNGAKDGQDKVSAAISDANQKVAALDGLDSFASQPVSLQEEKLHPVPDYGTGFAPYFMSLSLWVGALMMFFGIYMDPEARFKSREGAPRIARFLGYYGLGMVQAVVLGFVLQTGLHLQVQSAGLYYMTCIIISLSFIAIMKFLIVNLKDVGKFLAIIILILQLTSCGGTFPMELVPKFFTVLNPLMPMTYSVNALKEVISGVDYGFLSSNLVILGVIGLVFLFLSNIVVGKQEDRKKGVFSDNKETVSHAG